MPGTIGDYIVYRLKQLGVRHIFGIPGDFVLGFNKLIEDTADIDFINTCDEQGAGFAADAYARINGFSAICITYCVGGLKVVNPVAEAFAEKSPVLVISGAPGMAERSATPLLHHRVRDFDTQKHIFDELTVASAVIHSVDTAAQEIDRVIQAILDENRPGYIELPRDMVHQPIVISHINPLRPSVPPLPDSFDAAVAHATDMIRASHHPVMLVDAEIHRFHLHPTVVKLAESLSIPMAATVLGKSVISEIHPLYMGVYEGGLGHDAVRETVESSDCQILLGVLMSDMNLGIFTAKLSESKSIFLTAEHCMIGGKSYGKLPMGPFLDALLQASIPPKSVGIIPRPPESFPFAPQPMPMTVRRLFDAINSVLTDDMIIVADVGDSLFAAMDLVIRSHTEFISPAYYASIGFAIPASIGVGMIRPQLRPIVIVGDGAFQMTGNELSTAIRYRLAPIVIVLNNGGYGTERPILDGKFNDIFNWNYSRIPLLFGSGVGSKINTEPDLMTALHRALSDPTQLHLLEIIIDRDDRSEALSRLTAGLAQRV